MGLFVPRLRSPRLWRNICLSGLTGSDHLVYMKHFFLSDLIFQSNCLCPCEHSLVCCSSSWSSGVASLLVWSQLHPDSRRGLGEQECVWQLSPTYTQETMITRETRVVNPLLLKVNTHLELKVLCASLAEISSIMNARALWLEYQWPATPMHVKTSWQVEALRIK